ncbi:MAG: SDR family oxidoreductase [Pseudomonadota bacterium]
MTDKPSALILGARSDIALATAHKLAAKGHPLMLALRDPARLEEAKTDLEIRHSVPVSLHGFDALDIDGIEGFFDSLPSMPQIVICAVGAMDDQDKTVADSALAKRIIDANFTGPALAMEVAARRLAGMDADTAVVGISSVAGDRGRAKNYGYGAAKAGFTAWLSGLRQKYADSRVHVMTVKPGFVRTAMTDGMDLPGPMTVDPETVADLIASGIEKRRQVVYTPKWRIIMGIIGFIPESIFRKLKF